MNNPSPLTKDKRNFYLDGRPIYREEDVRLAVEQTLKEIGGTILAGSPEALGNIIREKGKVMEERARIKAIIRRNFPSVLEEKK